MALAGNADETAILSHRPADVGAGRRQAEHRAGGQRDAHRALSRRPTSRCACRAWTNDITDPSQITSYFAYFPNIESLHAGCQDKSVDELFVKRRQEMDTDKRAEQYKRDPGDLHRARRRSCSSTRSPYPVALRKNVKGFVQIPLGNNIFAGAYLEK